MLENGYQASEILIYSEIDARNCLEKRYQASENLIYGEIDARNYWKRDIGHRKSQFMEKSMPGIAGKEITSIGNWKFK
nr:hypothetical protein [uncultured Blautia sp.]